MVGLKQIFTWWNKKKLLGLFLKLYFLGNTLEVMNLGINIIKAKKMRDG